VGGGYYDNIYASILQEVSEVFQAEVYYLSEKRAPIINKVTIENIFFNSATQFKFVSNDFIFKAY
jgi:hypothetical protein